MTARTVTLSETAYRTVCGLVQDHDDVPDGTVFAATTVWEEIRERFPLSDYLPSCSICGEYFERETGPDRELGLCPSCAVSE